MQLIPAAWLIHHELKTPDKDALEEVYSSGATPEGGEEKRTWRHLQREVQEGTEEVEGRRGKGSFRHLGLLVFS